MIVYVGLSVNPSLSVSVCPVPLSGRLCKGGSSIDKEIGKDEVGVRQSIGRGRGREGGERKGMGGKERGRVIGWQGRQVAWAWKMH